MGLSLFSNKAKTQTTVAASAIVEISDPHVITGTHQLTFVGSRSGEGYFSKYGKKMIFQSERESGNPFYQIYLMDLVTGKTERVSPGKGKTTCSWIHPQGDRVMFSSTHLDKDFETKVKEEYETRKSPQKNKYSWSYDPQFDIYEYSLKTKKLKQLTHEFGYDAEGSYSPDGKQILFASNRAGYTDKLSPEDEKLFKQDPSYLMDLYMMNSDGSNIRRLTNMKGYNGGPFFSADGKKITWRHFAPNGQTAEIWTADVDGSHQQAITHLGSMSWAPYFHPSGDYIVFTTNLQGFSNFELYIVDTAGKHEPVRVSYIPDFDGLPVFTPDGQKLSWTHRNEKGESQVYLADWNDIKARELLQLPLQLPKMSELSAEPSSDNAKKIINFLASEQLGGRSTGSPGEKEMSEQVAKLFKEFGLQATKENSELVQTFEFSSGVNLGANESLKFKIRDQEIIGKVGDNFTPISFSKVGSFAEAPLAFAGYGIVAPAEESKPAYDSFKDLDVKGKWVLIFRDIPEGISNEKRIHLNMYSRLQHKALVASQRGAIGLLIANGPNSQSKQKIMRLRYDGTFSTTGIPVLSVSDELAEKMVSLSGRTLKKWQDVLDTGDVQNTDIKDVKAQATVDLKPIKSSGHNMIGKIAVSGAKTSILIAAHGDHLGRGEAGSSLARQDEQGKIHYGADDNASGVAGVIELARYFSEMNKKGKLKLKQNLIFAVWSGEEIGLIGSSYFVNKTQEKISANINMDMIGRLRENLLVQGVGSAKEWKKLFEQEARQTKLAIQTQEDPYLPTDSMAFYMKEIPAINFFTGAHGEYHSPRDVASLINYEGLTEIVQLVKSTTLTLAEAPKSLVTYEKVEGGKSRLEGRS